MDPLNQASQAKQRIKILSDYLKANPNYSKEQLLQASLVAGYTKSEFAEAILSFSERKVGLNIPKKLIILVTLGVVLSLLIIIFYFISKDKVFKTSGLMNKKTNESAEVTTEVFSPNPDKLFTTFSAYLKSKNVRISVSGNLDNKNRANLTALELEGGIFYLKNGELVRLDASVNACADKDFYCNEPRVKTQITELLLADGVYVLLPEKKLYYNKTLPLTEINLPLKEVTLDFKYSLPLIQLLEGKPDWQQSYDKSIVQSEWKKTGNFEWESEVIFRFNEIETVTRKPVSTRVVFDKDYRTVKSLLIKYPDEENWQILTFNYETIENLDNLLTIPKDNEYRKEAQ